MRVQRGRSSGNLCSRSRAQITYAERSHLHAAADAANPLDVVPVEGPVDEARNVRREPLKQMHTRTARKNRMGDVGGSQEED